MYCNVTAFQLPLFLHGGKKVHQAAYKFSFFVGFQPPNRPLFRTFLLCIILGRQDSRLFRKQNVLHVFKGQKHSFLISFSKGKWQMGQIN